MAVLPAAGAGRVVVGRTVVVVAGALVVVGACRVVVVVVVGLGAGAGVVVAGVVEVVDSTVGAGAVTGAGMVESAVDGSSRFRTTPAAVAVPRSPTIATTSKGAVIALVVGRHAGELKKTACCELCGDSFDEPAPGIAGRSARQMAERKRARRDADVRAAHPRLGGFLLAITDEPQDIKNWDKGAVGEERLGAGFDGLAGAGVVILHDRFRPGSTANIDHIAVTPTGVWVIDAKRYNGQVAEKDVGGWLRQDMRLFVGRRDCMKLVCGMQKQVDAVQRALGDEFAEVPVAPMLCFVDADWQWFAKPFSIGGVLVTWPRAARSRLVQPGSCLPATVVRIAARLDQRLRPAA